MFPGTPVLSLPFFDTRVTLDTRRGQVNHGTIEIRPPCFANKPPNPAMNILCGSLIVSNATVWKNEQYFKSVHDLTNIIARTNGIVAFPSTPAIGSWAALDTVGNLFRTNLPSAITNLSGNPNVATNILGAGFVTVSSNNSGTWTITGVASGETNFNGEVSVTNSTRIGLVNGKAANTNLLRSVQGGNGIVLTNEGTNVMFAIDPVVVASQANLTAASNTLNTAIVAATNSASVTNWITTRQPANAVLSNLVGTAANNVTNVVSLSTTNATSKPLTNYYTAGVLTLFGLEQGANITLTPNGSNIVIASTASGGLATNADQFAANTTLNIKSGALLTNITIWQSNALLPALIATNQPGGTIDLVTMLTTNAAGLRVTSNGAVVVHGVIGSLTNSFEVRRSNNTAAILAVTHSNTVRIIGPAQSGYGASLVIGSEDGSSQNNIELWTGTTISGRWRSDNTGNQIISAEGGGEIQLNYDGVSSGRVAFGMPGVGNIWYLVPSATVAAWHGGTGRRGQITNVWDIFMRSNIVFTEILGGSDTITLGPPAAASTYALKLPTVQGSNGQVITNDGSGNLGWWTPFNTVVSGAVTNANQFGAQPTLTIKEGAYFTNIMAWPSNVTGPSLIVNSKPGIGTNLFEVRNTNDNPVIFASTNAGITLVASNTLFLGPQTNADQVNILGGVTNWAAFQVKGASDFVGAVTNESSVNIAGGQTNWVGMQVNGTLMADSNLLVSAGLSASNSWVGGTYWWSTAGFTNHTATAGLTNLATNIVSGNLLTNNGDAVHIQWRIKMANLVPNTNQFQIIYGSETVLDTGLLPSSNSVCTADLWITRTGNTSQNAQGRLEWGPGSGASYAYTNTNVELVQTNGIATIFQLRHGARRVGAVTNNWTRAWFDPAVR